MMSHLCLPGATAKKMPCLLVRHSSSATKLRVARTSSVSIHTFGLLSVLPFRAAFSALVISSSFLYLDYQKADENTPPMAPASFAKKHFESEPKSAGRQLSELPS